MRLFQGASWSRAMLLGWFVVATVAPVSGWMLPDEDGDHECHGCCPEVMQPVDVQDCCVVTPELPPVPLPVRVTQTTPVSVCVEPVALWAAPRDVTSPAHTADPPSRSLPVLLRTSVLLI